MRLQSVVLLIVLLVTTTRAFLPAFSGVKRSFSIQMLSGNIKKSVQNAMIPVVVFWGTAFPSWAEMMPAPWSEGVKYEVVTKAPTDALRPKVGEQVAIRFKGSFKGNTFDDTFSTEQPYFYRCGVGLIVKGLDDAVANMQVGDRYKLTFGGSLGFGEKGKPSAPGKPRIPPNAEINYEVELVEIPGTQEEMIADYE